MSVIIRGMDKPTHCTECPLVPLCSACEGLDDVCPFCPDEELEENRWELYENRKVPKKIPDWCPIEQLEE